MVDSGARSRSWSALAKRGHHPLDEHLGAGVHGAGHLVQDQDGGPGQKARAIVLTLPGPEHRRVQQLGSSGYQLPLLMLTFAPSSSSTVS
jgi:hypothetical protein